jgi:hypothetical protein
MTTITNRTILHVPHNSPPRIGHASNHDDIRAIIHTRSFEKKNLKIPFRDTNDGYFAGWISVIFDDEGRLKSLPRNQNALQLVGDVAIAVGYTYAKYHNDSNGGDDEHGDVLLNLEDVFENRDSAIQFLRLQNDLIAINAQMNTAVLQMIGDRLTSAQELRGAVASTGLAERASQIRKGIRSFSFKREKLQQEYERLFSFAHGDSL